MMTSEKPVKLSKTRAKTPSRPKIGLRVGDVLFVLATSSIISALFLLQGSYERPSIFGSLIESESEKHAYAGDYLTARFAERKGLFKDAVTHYGVALSKDPYNKDLLEATYTRMVLAGELKKAAQLAERRVKIEPAVTGAAAKKVGAKVKEVGQEDTAASVESQPQLADIILAVRAIQKDDFKAALTRISPLYNEAKNKEPAVLEDEINQALYVLLYSWLQVAQGKTDMALATLRSYQSETLKPFLIYQQAVQLYLAKQDKEALSVFKKIDSQHQSFRSVNIYAHLQRALKNEDEAKTALDNFSRDNANFVIGPQEQLDLRKDMVLSRAIQLSISEVFQELGSYAASQQSYETARLLFSLSLNLDENAGYAYFMLATLAESEGWNEEASRLYNKIPENSGFRWNGRIKRALNTYEHGDIKGGKEQLSVMADEQPNDVRSVLSLADLLLKEKSYKQAIDAYTRALDRIERTEGKFSENHWSVFYARGIAYEQSNQWDKAEADFKQALVVSPEQPDVLNYLGYSWLVMNRNLPEAETMLRTAISKRPRDAHILDSYGWALYKLGRYEEATYFLERSNLLMPEEPSINDHLGDLYWQLGRKLEAKYQWNRALSYNPPDKDAALIHQKLEEGIAESLPPVKEPPATTAPAATKPNG